MSAIGVARLLALRKGANLCAMQRPHTPIPPRPYTVDEVADLLRLNRQTVLRMCRSGELAGAQKVGAHWRIPRATLAPLVDPEDDQ